MTKPAKKEAKADPKAATTRTKRASSRIAPAATVPSRPSARFSRPIAGSPAQRKKRVAARSGGNKVSNLTVNTTVPGEADILLYGVIGEDFWDEGITAKVFSETLQGIGDVTAIRLRINSGGGDVFDATAIYNMLVKHPARVVVEIEGVAASAATLIAMAGDQIHISANAHFMIHAASGGVRGSAAEIRQYITLLDNADELIRLTYAARTGIDDNELAALMAIDNWMTAAEALELGFVDAVDAAKQVEPATTPGANVTGTSPKVITPERLAALADNLQILSTTLEPMRIAASASIVQYPSGEDPQTVIPEEKEEHEMKMNAKLRAKCVAAGMPRDLDDAAANTWFDENTDLVLVDATSTSAAPVKPPVPANPAPAITAADIDAVIEAREKRVAAARRQWKDDVNAYVELAFGDAAPADLVSQCQAMQEDGIEAVRETILKAKEEQKDAGASLGLGVNLSPSQPRDRHLQAIRAGLLVRSMNNFVSPEPRLVQDESGRWQQIARTPQDVIAQHFPEASRPKDWEAFAQMPLIKLAEETLLADGHTHDQVRRLSAVTIAMAAMGYSRQAGLRNAAVHTTGSFPEITRDAVNKSLQVGYDEAPQTWRGPMRQGTSVSDFKDIHRVKLGAAANLPVWPDNTAPEIAKLAEEKEKYAVEAHAETLQFSWRLIVNDDLDALSRRPQLLGDASARTVNAVAWQQVTGNPTMADGVSLFSVASGNRKRANLITGAATPTNATIGKQKELMRLMRGLNTPEQDESDDILNLTPTYIVGPAALEETILKQVFSGADPAAGGNSAVYNTARTLQPIIEPLLDADSATGWYLFASPNRVDTIEVTFLQGQETPASHEWMDDSTMCQNFTIMQTFAAKAIDHRGVQKHAGA